VRPYEPKLAECSLLALARDSLDLVRPKAEAKSVQLAMVTQPSGGGPEQWRQLGDASQIKQVMLNLLLNALDASGPQGRVTLRLERSNRIEMSDARRGTTQIKSGTILEVCDRGPGLPDGDAERIFRPFYTTKSTGTGLGLSICRKIVDAHRGEIRAEKRGDETVFRVLLPHRHATSSKQQRQEAS
jgi:signal transduction histidine kinase